MIDWEATRVWGNAHEGRRGSCIAENDFEPDWASAMVGLSDRRNARAPRSTHTSPRWSRPQDRGRAQVAGAQGVHSGQSIDPNNHGRTPSPAVALFCQDVLYAREPSCRWNKANRRHPQTSHDRFRSTFFFLLLRGFYHGLCLSLVCFGLRATRLETAAGRRRPSPSLRHHHRRRRPQRTRTRAPP